MLRERTRPGLGIIEPCLPSPAKAPPSGPGWLCKIKHDGFRIVARRGPAGVQLITRNGNDLTGRFPFIEMAVKSLPGAGRIAAANASSFALRPEPFFGRKRRQFWHMCQKLHIVGEGKSEVVLRFWRRRAAGFCLWANRNELPL
jgi:hypothetical protein